MGHMQLETVVRGRLPEKLTFEQRPEVTWGERL